MWGVDWIHLGGVEVGIKKAQGDSWVWQYAFLLLFDPFQRGPGQGLRDWVGRR